MIYLTNDCMEQAVYLDLERGFDSRKRGGGEKSFHGVLGNGVNELPVRLKSTTAGTEVTFGSGRLFRFVDEDVIKRMIVETMRDFSRDHKAGK